MDTTFWVGDADLNDDFHESAHSVIEALLMGGTPMALTTDFVLGETVTILGKRRGFGAEKAVKVVKSVLSSPRVFTIYIDDSFFKEVLRLYPMYEGKLSFTDITSIVVMEKYGVKKIFSHDRDFDEAEGVRRLESPIHRLKP